MTRKKNTPASSPKTTPAAAPVDTTPPAEERPEESEAEATALEGAAFQEGDEPESEATLVPAPASALYDHPNTSDAPVAAPAAYSVAGMSEALTLALKEAPPEVREKMEQALGGSLEEKVAALQEGLGKMVHLLAQDMRAKIDFVVSPNIQPLVLGGCLVDREGPASPADHMAAMQIITIGIDLVHRIADVIQGRAAELDAGARAHAARPDLAFASHQLSVLAEELRTLKLPLGPSHAFENLPEQMREALAEQTAGPPDERA